MRRFLILLVSCIAALWSCQEQPVELKVSESSISFDTGVSSKMITISSNYPWSISVPSNWLSLSLNRGEAGEYTISVTCTANNSTSDRSTELRLISEDSELSIKIFQDGRILRVQGMDNKLELDFMAQDFKIDVLSNSTYYHVITYPSVTFPHITASWLSRVDTKSASVSTIVFHASRNNDVEPRTATITLRSGLSASIVVEVTQAGSPVLNVRDHKLNFKSFGGSTELPISCSDVPEVTYSEGTDWLSFSGSIEEGFTLTATENIKDESREADIILTLGDLSETIHVTQDGAPKDPYLDLSGKTDATISSEGGVLSFDVYSNTSITLSGHSDWAEVGSIERDGSHYTVTVKVQPYPIPDDALIAFDDRSWNISIADSTEMLSDSFTIIQTPEDYKSLKLNMAIQVQKKLDVALTGDAPVGCVKVGTAKTKVENNKATVQLEPAEDLNVEICSRGADAVTFHAIDMMRIIVNPESITIKSDVDTNN